MYEASNECCANRAAGNRNFQLIFLLTIRLEREAETI